MKSKITRSFFVFVVFGAASCISEKMTPQVDCSINPVEISLVESNATGCNTSSGGFSVVASGGEPPYEYSSTSDTNETGGFSSLSAGSHTVSATDQRGCSSEITISIENEEGVNLESLISEDSGCGSSNGSIEVTASGGEEPHLFSLNGGTPQESNTFSSLERGTYLVKAMDQQGCETSQSVQITSGVSYNASVKSIIASSCATSNCHGGSQSPNLSTLGGIQTSANRIKARSGAGTMPPSGSLPQSQIDLIACWVDDGALDN